MITTSTSNLWVKFLSPNPEANLRLFCLPHAGSSSLDFRNWSDQLPTTVEICSIELPGRGRRMQEKPFTRMSPLVEAIALALLPYLNRPFAFFGHSMGGLISFELARFLRRNYRRYPAHLFISGRRAPQVPTLEPPIHARPDSEFLQELHRLNGTPEAVLKHAELMQLLLPTLRADFAVLETYGYTPEPPLDCSITAFGGLQDPNVRCEGLEAWREQTNTAFSLEMFPGDHFFLYTAQSALLQSLSQALHKIINPTESS